MKKWKRVSALVLALALMLSGMPLSQAAVSQEAKNLNQMKLLLGIEEMELSQGLNRVIGITMVLKALGYQDLDTKAKVSANPFVDMDGNNWAKGFAAIAYEKGYTKGFAAIAYEKGYTKGIGKDSHGLKFGPEAALSKKEFLTFMLRVLGYDGKEAWENTERLAQKAKILVDGSEKDRHFSKDDAARIMFASLDSKLVNAEGRLVDHLIREGKVTKQSATAVGLLAPELPKELAVEAVKAENLREIEVQFTREVNEETAKRVANYRLTAEKGGSRGLVSARLSADKKTVLLTVGPSVLANRQNYKLTVSGVKDLQGQSLNKSEHSFVADDRTPPSVQSVEFTGPRNLQITMTEPIQTVGRVKLYQGKSEVSTKAAVKDAARENVIHVETYSQFKDIEYEVRIEEMKDYAGYVGVIYVQNHRFEKVASLPYAEVVAADEGKVEIQFDRPVRGITRRHFYHDYRLQTAKAVYKDEALSQSVAPGDYVTKIWVVFATAVGGDNYPMSGKTMLSITGKVDGQQIQDNWGNNFEDYSTFVNVESDRSVPVVEKVEVESDSKIVVTFNENLSVAGSYKILNSNGNSLTVPSASLKGRVVTLSFSPLNVKNAILEISGVKDSAFNQNTLVLERMPIEFTDKVFAGVDSVDFRPILDGGNITGGEIYINFKEAVSGSALVNENYRLELNGNQEKIDDQDLSFGDNNKIVVLRLNEVMAKKVRDHLATAKLLMSKVTDLAGNEPAGFFISVEIKGAVAASLQESILVEESGVSKLQMRFSRGIANILKANQFSILAKPLVFLDADAANPADLTISGVDISSKDNRDVEITFSHRIYDPAGLQVQIAADTLEDVQGTKLAVVTSGAISDKTAPKIKTDNYVKKAYGYKDSGRYYIKLYYTEAIDVNSLSSGTYRLDGDSNFTLKSDRPAVSGAQSNEVVMEVEIKAGANFSADLNLVQVQELTDKSRNRFIDGSSITITKADTWVE